MQVFLNIVLVATLLELVQSTSLRETVQLALDEANDSTLRGSLQQALQEAGTKSYAQTCAQKSDPVCYELLDTWWNTREAQKGRAALSVLDEQCDTFTDFADACNDMTQRTLANTNTTIYAKIVADPELQTIACTMVGAHSKRCIGNPCNHYNLGNCTIQETQGQCFWYTTAMVKQVNKYYDAHPEIDASKIPGHGCYRNPCNLPGEGSTIDKCPGLSTDIFTCTYCKGPGDKCLKGRGMGCQLTTPTTSAECAYVNDNDVAKASIWERVDQQNCQCSDLFTQCNSTIYPDGTRSGAFQQRYA
mmetsp:Transcript_7708/g.15295  ORF Transcript_7708/g.15295 Transcript_7708/m.15295 type:complete len:303 (+) Transcript_7708:76-984(+)|eukprot:CAMPEP_0171485196 /NCGR_PEP_ID=MMETSP0958-20121227/410_1 /TAXON_ID=87120 /ORGANISM="Aurantiochytrium limacinum, Strain ATCCMYA-1381" /LENGTH=302 /DNA_ID=CAMNT_0012017957 /DNA_START=144 /DNA_END=1052 /DNA_ORIENTATION=-